jgi:hypothetical protein
VAPILLGLATFAQPAYAVPVTLTLDNPHQTIARPASGEIVLNFTGTVSFGRDFHFEEAKLDFDYNSSSTEGIPTEFGPVDFSDANNGGSVTGVLFTAEISSSTALGLYGFEFGTKEPATLSIEGADDETFVTVSRSFSIRVTNGTAVPEAPSSALLLGVSFVSLVLFQCTQWGRIRQKPRAVERLTTADALRLKALPQTARCSGKFSKSSAR